MELMIDLACHAQGCFRSEDPLEAARFVVSQAVSALWETVLDARGFTEFTARAAPQLVRWEREYGWSEGLGAGKVREQERPLAEALAPTLDTPDMLRGFADAYLAELDRIAAAEAPPPGKNNRRIRRDWADSFLDRDYTKRRRTGNLARWNSLLLEHLDTGRAQRLAAYTAFSGPEADFLKAQAARLRGDLDEARTLITECLKYFRREHGVRRLRRRGGRRSPALGWIRVWRAPELVRISFAPGAQHFLKFFPLPHGQGSFRPVFPAGCCFAVRGSRWALSAQAVTRGTRLPARCRACSACCRSSRASSGLRLSCR